MNPMSKYWCFTINNPTEFDEGQLDLLKDESTYLVYQREAGENGTEHYQGYVEFEVRKRMDLVKRIIPRAHLERRQGNAQQAADYCKKEEGRLAGPFEFGECSGNFVGKRNDLNEMKGIVSDNARSKKNIIKENFSVYARHHRFFNEWYHLSTKNRNFKTRTVVFWGAADTGKTAIAQMLPKPFSVAEGTSTVWYDGYDPRYNQTVIFDDFKGDVRFREFLKLSDRYPYNVNCKGSQIVWKPKFLALTSNYRPKEWYPKKLEEGTETFNAFWRRVDLCINFVDKDNLIIEKGSINCLPETVQDALRLNFVIEQRIYNLV